jgi:phage terminase small subunit
MTALPKPGRPSDLTPKQQRFVDEYLIDLNATQAAIRAGYSARTADVQASQILSIPKVAAAVEAAIGERSKRTEITGDSVLRELLLIATADIGQAFDEAGCLLPLGEMPENTRRAISAIESDELFDGVGKDRKRIGLMRKVKFWDKPRALEMLGKHLKLFVDRAELTGASGAPLIPPQPPTILETARALAWILTKAAHDQEQAAKQDHLEDSP